MRSKVNLYVLDKGVRIRHKDRQSGFEFEALIKRRKKYIKQLGYIIQLKLYRILFFLKGCDEKDKIKCK